MVIQTNNEFFDYFEKTSVWNRCLYLGLFFDDIVCKQ